MGFTCGIYRTKKLIPDVTRADIRAINAYYEYQNNSWSKENYSDWKSCAKAWYDGENVNCDVSQETIDLYKDEFKDNSINHEIDVWCSNGTYFHDFIENIKMESKSDFLSKADCISIFKYAMEQLDLMEFKQVVARRAFKLEGDSEEDIEDRPITSMRCDGIEIEDEDGNIRRVYTDNWEYSDLFVPKSNCFDEYRYYAFKALRDAMIIILTEVDFDNEVIIYEGGW